MKSHFISKVILTSIFLTLYLLGFTQIDEAKLKSSISTALQKTQKKQKVFIESESQKEIQDTLYAIITSEVTGNIRQKQVNLVADILIVKTMLGIETLAYQEQFEDKTLLEFKALNINPLKKYAVILINIDCDKYKTASIFLNSNFICNLADAKNGVLVRSNTKYLFEIKYKGMTYCINEFLLNSNETKEITCSIYN